MPIAGPVDATWVEFGAALREAWTQTTAAANWIVTELYVRDVRRIAGDTKLPSMPKVYLYPEARTKFPLISPINLTALLQQADQTYRRQRYELLWTGARSLAVHRYPVPTPLHSQAWRLRGPDPANGAMIVDVRLGDRWWALRLRRGAEFHRQTQQLIALQTGAALAGAGALLGISAHIGDHRHMETQRRVLLKLTGWFPRPHLRGAIGDVRITTAVSDFLIVRRDHHPPWTIHGDELRRLIRAYETQRFRHVRPDAAARYAGRIKAICQQIAAAVARRAVDAGVVRVCYEDEERGFCDPFPWTKFRLWLQSAVEGRGLMWIYASGAAPTSSVTPLAKTIGTGQ